ncbi:MAG: AAA family ATPase [Nitrospinota bacterium]
MDSQQTAETNDLLTLSSMVFDFSSEVAKVIIGQKEMIDSIIAALISDGHILIEGVPGLAKTLTISTVAQGLGLSFKRIQFTPDLMPSDLTGSEIYNVKESKFQIRKGPLFSNIILADEINRAPAKVQSALLEAMQERQITLGDTTYPLPEPFIVMATQNPIEHEGAYPLPEAQIDRFMLKIVVDYPLFEEETVVVNRNIENKIEDLKPILYSKHISQIRQVVQNIYIDNKLVEYIVKIVHLTRSADKSGLDIDKYIEFGASPRASIYLAKMAKAYAFFDSRNYCTPSDIKKSAYDVLRHRISLTYEADAKQVTAVDLINQILDRVKVP